MPLSRLLILLGLGLQPLAAAAGKLGLCCEACTPTTYGPFANATSWVYRYSLFVDDADAAAWLVKNDVEVRMPARIPAAVRERAMLCARRARCQRHADAARPPGRPAPVTGPCAVASQFVPHLAHKHVPLPDGSACNFDAATKNTPLCTDAMLDSALAKNAKGLKINFVMGWNEAYDQGNAKAKKKYIAPADAATYWRTMLQGMAKRANVKLVSPTTGVETHKLQWLADMLLACWSQRSASPGCDVETVAAFSVHDYKCGEPYWRSNYGTNGTFQTQLGRYLGKAAAGKGKDWAAFVDARPIWVTETNCNGDNGFPSSGPVSRGEQCARITGQRAEQKCGQYGLCGKGSIAAMESMDSVSRVSWWNTWQQNRNNATKTANAMLVDTTGKLFPAGRALASGLTNMDCSV